MAAGSLSFSALMASLEHALEARQTESRQPLLWLRGQSSGIHETTLWSESGFYPFVGRHFQVLSSEIAEADEVKKRISEYARAPILILTGYFTQATESDPVWRLEELIASSRTVILYGNESAYGGSYPAGIQDIEERFLRRNEKPVIKLPGNPTPGRYLLGTLNHLILYDRVPELDEYRRPKMFYAEKICDRCEYRSDFETGNFVRHFGEREGCLYLLGCKGPITRNSCPTAKFNESRSWCVSVGSPCTGCSEPDFDSHSGLGLFGPLSSGGTGINSFFIRNSETIAKGVAGITAVGIGLHAFFKKASPPVEISTELPHGEKIDE